MNTLEIKKKRRIRRKYQIRKKITGTSDRLRLTIFRSLNHIYAQIINDVDRKTLVSASSKDKDVQAKLIPGTAKMAQSQIVGEFLAAKAKEKNITKVAFDRNGFIYHGRVKAFADAVRKGGLEF